MPAHINLHGDKSEQFQRYKDVLTEEFGYEPSNPEVLGLLMAAVEEDSIVQGSNGPIGDPDDQ